MDAYALLYCVGNVMGYPGVFQSNPHPYLSKPVPASMGTGQGFTKTHGYPNPREVVPSEMTNEPRKGSASVNGHCRANLARIGKSSVGR